MYDYMKIYESLVNGQARQATEQLKAANMSLYELVNSLLDAGYSEAQVLHEIKKLRV